MEEGTVYYTVIKLTKEIIVNDDNGNELRRQLSNCYGFLPVYDNYEDALAASENETFSIIPLILDTRTNQETEEPNQDSEEIQTFE
jgi:hypothetical protein